MPRFMRPEATPISTVRGSQGMFTQEACFLKMVSEGRGGGLTQCCQCDCRRVPGIAGRFISKDSCRFGHDEAPHDEV